MRALTALRPALPLVRRAVVAGLMLLPIPALAQAPASAEQPIVVFAAASLKTALDEINAAFTKASGVAVKASYAASSALARQIEQQAPADLFASADLEWMDYLDKKGLVATPTRVNLLNNRLVVVAGKTSPLAEVKLAPGALPAALKDGRLATGEVTAVPAGKYAKSALEKLGLWGEVSGKLAQAENVRAALLLVSRGEAPLGIVYATDAAADPEVKVVATFPEDSHPPIVYPFALTKTAGPQAARYLAFLQGPEAQSVFAKNGFSVIKRGS